MLMIDGSQGEGGGQIVRSSLAMSLITGRPFMMDRIRAGRKKPGLMRQHLASVHAAATVGKAHVEGAEMGSTRLTFRPNEIVPGTHHFRVGTAGSATLVLQTVLPPLLIADDESHLTLEGGTHNAWAPPLDFLQHAFLPLVNRMGPSVTVDLRRPGFYPRGGGAFSAHIQPSHTLVGGELLERGNLIERKVRAVVSALPQHIAKRECDRIARKTGWPQACFHIHQVEAPRGPGNVVTIELHSAHVTEVFTGFGQLGVRAEQVADRTLKAARAYLEADVPVGPHLADQLMLPLGVSAHLGGGGGAFHTMPLTRHSITHIDVLQQFLNVRVTTTNTERDNCIVRIDRART